MVANQNNMLLTFDDCNMKYFEGKLLFPQFDLLHSFRTCGYFHYMKGGWFDKTIYDPIISITDYYDYLNTNFDSARLLFTHSDFVKAPFMQDDFTMSLYQGLCKGSNINIAIINSRSR